jgi:uncharacterized protein
VKIVLDTNIFLAGLLSDGLCREIIGIVFGPKSEHQVFVSVDIWLELQTTIKRYKLVDNSYLPHLEHSLKNRAFWIEPTEKINLIKSDPDDNKILECAAVCQADLIISMDKHLTKVKRFRNTGIIHPQTFFFVFPSNQTK